MIKFEKENDCYYAIELNADYNGQCCEEIWWAEISPCGEGFNIQFDDDYRNKIMVGSLEIAKEFIMKNYHLHTPQIVGKRWDL